MIRNLSFTTTKNTNVFEEWKKDGRSADEINKSLFPEKKTKQNPKRETKETFSGVITRIEIKGNNCVLLSVKTNKKFQRCQIKENSCKIEEWETVRKTCIGDEVIVSGHLSKNNEMLFVSSFLKRKSFSFCKNVPENCFSFKEIENQLKENCIEKGDFNVLCSIIEKRNVLFIKKKDGSLVKRQTLVLIDSFFKEVNLVLWESQITEIKILKEKETLLFTALGFIYEEGVIHTVLNSKTNIEPVQYSILLEKKTKPKAKTIKEACFKVSRAERVEEVNCSIFGCITDFDLKRLDVIASCFFCNRNFIVKEKEKICLFCHEPTINFSYSILRLGLMDTTGELRRCLLVSEDVEGLIECSSIDYLKKKEKEKLRIQKRVLLKDIVCFIWFEKEKKEIKAYLSIQR